eukprot:3085174-Amphidinium_carterae.2
MEWIPKRRKKENIVKQTIDGLDDFEYPQNAQFFDSLLQSLTAPDFTAIMAHVLQSNDGEGDHEVPTVCEAQALGAPSPKLHSDPSVRIWSWLQMTSMAMLQA